MVLIYVLCYSYYYYTMVPLSITIYILWYPYLYYIMVPIYMPYYGNYIYAHIHTLLPIPKPIPIYGTHIYTLLWHPYLSLVLIFILCFQYLHCATLIHTHIFTMVPSFLVYKAYSFSIFLSLPQH